MKKAFITGISGFAGSHLASFLLSQGFSVSGTYLTSDSLENLSNRNELSLHQVNLLDENKTHSAINSEKPDFIFHLAALSPPGKSFDNPKETFITNISSQLNVFQAIKNSKLTKARILIVSSAEVYGHVSKDDLPIDEETPFNPTNPYAVSKLTQDFLGLQAFLTDKLKIVRVRPFNHIGPRQSTMFAISAFAKRIVEIEKGKIDSMKVGNLSAKRDFTDVRDMVKAYKLALEKGAEGEVYNIGSGTSHQMSEILEMLTGMSTKEIKVENDPALMRPADDPELVCDNTKFKTLTGWEPEIPIETTLKDTLDYWRDII